MYAVYPLMHFVADSTGGNHCSKEVVQH